MSRLAHRLNDVHCRPLFATLLLLAPIAAATTVDPGADGRQQARPEVAAVEILDDVELDGVLDDAVWRSAPVAGGFSEFEPDRGLPASVETLFRIAFDQHALYFAITCRDDVVTSVLSRRDNIADSDHVDIYLDPYGDRTTGYLFRCTPHGVLADATIFDDGSTDLDWDTVWEAECVRDDHGWTAEVRIPFSALRIRAGAPWWGLQVGRYRHWTGEEDAWSCWGREQSGFVSRFGQLVGLEEIRPARRIELLPYAVLRVEDPAGDQDFSDEVDVTANAGFDLRAGLSSNFTVNVTVQPDFGQVEVDPAELNLSPYETFFAEKRPFFVEGASYFQHPEFNLFYTRRIGLGHENARIRGAAKVLGKTRGGTSVGVLVASTDITGDDQAHNPFKSGEDGRYFAVTRVGQDFLDGTHSVHLMGTATGKRVGDEPEAMAGGLDFDCNFRDRAWNVSGSLVGSNVAVGESKRTNGVGATFGVAEVAGAWQGGVNGRLEDDTLELNHLGYLRDPNKIEAGGWLGYDYHASDADAAVNLVSTRLDVQKSWIAGGRTVRDLADPGTMLWSYDAGHRRELWFELGSHLRHRDFWSADLSLYYGLEYTAPTDSRRTIEYGAGPLVTNPPEYGFTLGGSTDPRRRFSGSLHFNLYAGDQGNRDAFLIGRAAWIQNPRLKHELSFSLIDSRHARQHLMNTAWDPFGGGIGGVHYVFAELRRTICDLTLRSNVLFGRNTSLELYLQPYLTRGNYRDAKELVRPDSDEFRPWSEPGFDVNDSDLLVGAVNFKAVFRWQYRRGSTFFLAWTHSRFRFEQRWMGGDEDLFDGRMLGTLDEAWFRQEPENVILAKITWWLDL